MQKFPPPLCRGKFKSVLGIIMEEVYTSNPFCLMFEHSNDYLANWKFTARFFSLTCKFNAIFHKCFEQKFQQILSTTFEANLFYARLHVIERIKELLMMNFNFIFFKSEKRAL
jgi:hypothetical protein